MDSYFLPNKCCYSQIDGSCYKITESSALQEVFHDSKSCYSCSVRYEFRKTMRVEIRSYDRGN